MGHGPFGSALVALLQRYYFKVVHLSHLSGEDETGALDMIFLAIPARHVVSTTESTLGAFGGIIVDCAGSCPTAAALSGVLTRTVLTHRRYVKAMGDLSVYDLLADDVQLTYNQGRTLLCGVYEEDCHAVSELLEAAQLQPRSVGPLTNMQKIEDKYKRLFPGWGTAILITAGTWFFCMLYALSRYLGSWCCGSYDNSRAPMYLFNKVHCWSGLWILSLTYFLGGVGKVLREDQTPRWLVGLLNIRKQFGLCGVWLIVMHAIVSMLIFNQSYYGKFHKEDGTLQEWAEWSLFFGVLAFMILLPTVVTSFVGSYTFREWRCAQFHLGMLTLVFAVIHVVVMGNPTGKDGWKAVGDSAVHKGMPSITFMSSVPVLFTIAFRMFTEMIPARFLPKPGKFNLSKQGLDCCCRVSVDTGSSNTENEQADGISYTAGDHKAVQQRKMARRSSAN
jgi:predicted dinucleotide-binding enzyme/DMSO/TMAO reductase YedYZ heme-binding membrane subunit